MNKRLPLVVRRILYNLRGGFLLRPFAIALALGAAGAALSWLEEMSPQTSRWVPKYLFPTRADPVVAQVILSSIATATMTVVSIVFAILLMTLTLASMQFSPRIIVSFSRDRSTQWTLGIFLGTFCYCMAALPAAHTRPTPFAPVATVTVAMGLALACVGWLLYFIHHISHAISVNYIVDRIAAETEVVIDDIMPRPRTSPKMQPPTPVIAWDAVIVSDISGYIRVIDVHRLFVLARTYRVKARTLRRVGHFVPRGVPLLEVAKGDRLSAAAVAEFRQSFDIGPSRTLQQDVEFGVLQIVDIALRAISPAVNDPSTAINCIDQLSRILIRMAARQEPTSLHYDLPGEIRLLVPWISFQGLLHSAFDQIRVYAASDMAVRLRLLRALRDIATTLEPGDIRSLLMRWGSSIVDGRDREQTDAQTHLLKERLAALHDLERVDGRLTAL